MKHSIKEKKQKTGTTHKLTLSAMFLALCILLPLLTGNIPKIGNMLCPMHIPVLLCGMLCGWQYGLTVGIIAPLLRGLIFSVPPILPIGIPMSVELAVYGLIAGLIFALFKKRRLLGSYVALITAMIIGRIAWGGAMYVVARLSGMDFTHKSFISAAFLTAVPGIVIQLVLIPAVVVGLIKAKLI